MEFKHYSVLLDECIQGLNIREDGVYVDGTAGGAGHSCEIAKRLKSGRLYALDQDPDAIEVATQRLSDYNVAKVVQSNFADMEEALLQCDETNGVDGVLLDLGVSSFQLDSAERGFSYMNDAPLDMRMSQSGLSAKDVVNNYSVSQLISILRNYGEEKYAKNIAFHIQRAREQKPIETTLELAEIIKSSMPAAARREKNPCKRSFQAIRIEVNGELSKLEQGLEHAFHSLNLGGRLVIITFHSLEDRIVKQKFRAWCTGCVCPPDLPTCVCNQKPKAKLINKKPILPSSEELLNNKRSKSAKLRILEKI